MNGFQSSLYTVGVALCVFSAGVLSGKRTHADRRVSYFVAFLGVETLGFLLELLMAHPGAPLKAVWLGLRLSTALWVAPCVWLAIHERVRGSAPTLGAFLRHEGGPILVGGLAALPLMFSAHWGTTYANPLNPTPLPESRLIHGSMLLCIAIFAVQVPVYLSRSNRLLRAPSAATDGPQLSRPVHRWLLLPVFVALATWILGLLRTLHCVTHARQEWVVLYALVDVGVTVGSTYLIVRQLTLSPGPPEPAEAPAPETGPGSVAPQVRSPIAVVELPPAPAAMLVVPIAPPVAKKYAKTRLGVPQRERIKRKLEAALATEEVCHDSLLNLRTLSQRLGEKPHYVSQVINQDLATTFYELLNRARISQAKRHLLKSPTQTILEIALAVGFNAKSTFNAAFRQQTGLTPTQYREQNRRDPAA